MQFDTIKALVKEDFHSVDQLIITSLHSKASIINDLGHYIIQSGGKRLRPLVVLLIAKACGYEGQDHIALAAIIEIIHTATLLHDDVVDEAELRRGRQRPIPFGEMWRQCWLAIFFIPRPFRL